MSATVVKGWCALCRSRCGCLSTIEDGRLVRVDPDPGHPTGAALCAKGRAAPELVDADDRLLTPLVRTRPKGDPDPGWQAISWDEALDRIAARLKAIAAASGPESVAFAPTTPSGTGLSDSIQWIERLIHAFGSPNNCYGTEICNWHKDVATAYTFGRGVGTPDFETTGCLVLWGHNPSTAWLAQANRAASARARGMRLVVIDPRRVGLAAKADLWLRVRPGSDGALALALIGETIRHELYDAAFVRAWTNGPFLIRDDTEAPLTGADLGDGGPDGGFVAWDDVAGRAVRYDPASRHYGCAPAQLRLRGTVEVATPNGAIPARPVFERLAERAAAMSPEWAERLCWIPAEEIRATARLLAESRPVAYHAWSGVGQHTNATQTDRAISVLYALTGDCDAPGGNVYFDRPPVADMSGRDLLSEAQRAKALGRDARPLGPARDGWVTAEDLYRAVIDGEPYPVRALVAFGTNLLASRADPARGAAALARLDFHVHADLFMNPSAAFADIVLPVNSPWEREGLRAGFEIDRRAASRLQWRPAVVAPRGESRSDADIVFDLAVRLGLGAHFWNGDRAAAEAAMLAPTGITPARLRASPDGIDLALETRYRKYEQDGFATPSGKIELWSEAFRRAGQPPLPDFVEPALGPAAPEATAFPLVLTSAKSTQFCHSQHRNLPTLRRRVPHPEIEIHPDTAAARGIAAGDWVEIATPSGRLRARAVFRDSLDRRVVAAQHGWWQACAPLGLPGYDALAPEGANYNLAIGGAARDPVSGSVPLRSYLCEVRPAARPEAD